MSAAAAGGGDGGDDDGDDDMSTGVARGVVIGTGDRTLMGRIASIAARMEVGEETLIAQEIGHFVRIITGISIFISVLFFLLSVIVGFYWVDALIYLVGLLVACVPEGILPTITAVSYTHLTLPTIYSV